MQTQLDSSITPAAHLPPTRRRFPLTFLQVPCALDARLFSQRVEAPGQQLSCEMHAELAVAHLQQRRGRGTPFMAVLCQSGCKVPTAQTPASIVCTAGRQELSQHTQVQAATHWQLLLLPLGKHMRSEQQLPPLHPNLEPEMHCGAGGTRQGLFFSRCASHSGTHARRLDPKSAMHRRLHVPYRLASAIGVGRRVALAVGCAIRAAAAACIRQAFAT